MKKYLSITILSLSLLSGCAGIQFYGAPTDEAMTYFEPEPYLFVSVNAECTFIATAISLPGKKRSLSMKSGYGSAELSVGLEKGIITSLGQKTDTKIPETITAIGGLTKNLSDAKLFGVESKRSCTPQGQLYHIVDGVPDAKPLKIIDAIFTSQSGKAIE